MKFYEIFLLCSSGYFTALGQAGAKYRAGEDDTFSETFQMIFTDELILFIPAFLSLGFIVWYFNDKIKAK